jgi:hypothetical protein
LQQVKIIAARIYVKQQHPEKRMALLADLGSMKNQLEAF